MKLNDLSPDQLERLITAFGALSPETVTADGERSPAEAAAAHREAADALSKLLTELRLDASEVSEEAVYEVWMSRRRARRSNPRA